MEGFPKMVPQDSFIVSPARSTGRKLYDYRNECDNEFLHSLSITTQDMMKALGTFPDVATASICPATIPAQRTVGESKQSL